MASRAVESDKLSNLHLAKTFYFYLSKAKSIRFSDYINILRPFGFAQKPSLRFSISVRVSFSINC
jgi:hypothetical protein